ncbi:MAG: glycerol-3-phosphate dehydrogenase subunit GlpB [Muribaculaceae bacterium]|nr:glycerol-3-phosphate dehydrogenase subunit GlpB [Muribaculaceae bacterium]
MRFDVIIIGGGLSGLTAGIALAEAGKDVALVSAGQSTLHFGSGSLDLLGCDDKGNDIYKPIDAIATLGEKHPYNKLEDVSGLAGVAKQLLERAGIATTGDANVNHWRITPIGGLMPTWLSMEGMAIVQDPDQMPWKRVALVNIANYLDFPTKFLAAGLRERGVQVDVKAVTVPQLAQLRKSPTEMRSTNIAKVIESNDIINDIADKINSITGEGYDMVLLPAVLGVASSENSKKLLSLIKMPASYVATLPPSVTGVRLQTQLRKRFNSLGGSFFPGDQVIEGVFENNVLKGVKTAKLDGTTLEADNFILATGSFMSRGLKADYDHIYEPALGVDVDDMGLDRKTWAKIDVNEAQPYMEMGVKTDEKLRCLRNGTAINNLYAVGSILSGHNSIKLLDAAGVDMLTALQVANNIIK